MRATEFVESYIDAWNHFDPEGVADHLADDGIYRDIPENLQQTHDELVSYLRKLFASTRYRYELVGDILTGRNSISFQYRATPTKWMDEARPRPTFFGAEFVTLHGVSALTITDYYDDPSSHDSQQLENIRRDRSERHKYAKSGLDKQQLREYMQRLEAVMRDQRIYLRPDLTLPKLAKTVDCSVNHLSQVINAGFGMSFFDYLNRYRIGHARDLLQNSDAQSSVVLNVAYSVGFNSNSAFYAAFKKLVGQTPAQFRRNCSSPRH